MQTSMMIAIFGLIGIFSRYGLDKVIGTSASGFPVATFAINILGCMAAGFIYELGSRHGFSVSVHTGLLVGFCGGFTTFSAYALQSVVMIDSGKIAPAILYLVLSPALGFIAVLLPRLIIQRF